MTTIFPSKNFFLTKFSPRRYISPLWMFWINSVPPAKRPPTSFSTVTPINIGVRPKNFWLIVSTFLPYLRKISRRYLMPVPNYWPWTKSAPQKHCFFLWNPYKIEVMITSVMKKLELPNFGHMTTSSMRFE